MNVSKQDKVGAAPLPSDPESKTATAEMNKILEQAIQNLPEQYRLVVMMRAYRQWGLAGDHSRNSRHFSGVPINPADVLRACTPTARYRNHYQECDYI